jgi:hypothetical protein
MSAAPVPDGLAAEIDAVGEAALHADPHLALRAAAVALHAKQGQIMARYCELLGRAIAQFRPGRQ